MKRKVLGLRTVIYRVKDIQAAKEWYAEVFETQPYFDEPYYVGFEIDGYELGLQAEEAADSPKTESVVAYWGVENIESEFKRFVASGAVVNEAPRNVGGDIMVGKLADPWGNIIGLIYNPHFKILPQ